MSILNQSNHHFASQVQYSKCILISDFSDILGSETKVPHLFLAVYVFNILYWCGSQCSSSRSTTSQSMFLYTFFVDLILAAML